MEASQHRTLDKMPDLVLEKICEKLDFLAIRSARKSCRALRNYLDDRRFPVNLYAVTVVVKFFSIYLKIEEKETSEMIFIRYTYHPKGCVVKSATYGNPQMKRFPGVNFVDMFCADFQVNFIRQETCLGELYFDFDGAQTEYPLFGRLPAILNAGAQPIKVESLRMRLRGSEDMHMVIPHIEIRRAPEYLKDIYLDRNVRQREFFLSVEDTEQISQSNAWRAAHIETNIRLESSASLVHFAHMYELDIAVLDMFADDLFLLKDLLLDTNLRLVRIAFDFFDDVDRFIDRLGPLMFDWNGGEKWYFEHQPRNILYVELYEKNFAIGFTDEIERWARISPMF